jgi:hypothetical protein
MKLTEFDKVDVAKSTKLKRVDNQGLVTLEMLKV